VVVVVVVDLVVLEELKRCEIRRNLNRNQTAFFAVVESEKKMKNGKWWYIQHVPAILIFCFCFCFSGLIIGLHQAGLCVVVCYLHPVS
jgi:hypothetical protein